MTFSTARSTRVIDHGVAIGTQQAMEAELATKPTKLVSNETKTRTDAPWTSLITYRLQSISTAFRNQTADLLAKTDLLPTQWNLLALMITSNSSSAKELLDATDLGKALVSRTLQGMENSGLVIRYKCEDDLRVDRFRITNLGMDKYEKARPIMEARRKSLEDCIERYDRNRVLEIFDALEAEIAKRDF